MEKTCDLCLNVRPVVYCKADASRLCLSCDAKVHAANTIVDCHPRFLLCNSCNYKSAEFKCLDHRMFMCDICDCSLHMNCSGHQKQTMTSSYTGCPSAKEFAAFWGFELNKNLSSGSVVNLEVPGSDTYKIFQKSSWTWFVLDQILDLKRLQLSENNYFQDDRDQKSGTSSSVHHNMTKKRAEDNLVHQLIRLESDSDTRSQLRESRVNWDVKDHPLHFASSSTVGSPSYTEPFWQSRNLMQNTQPWTQNMQDIGICEDLPYARVDLSTLDVDSTFRNFEESFGGDQYVAYSFSEKDVSRNEKHERGYADVEFTNL